MQADDLAALGISLILSHHPLSTGIHHQLVSDFSDVQHSSIMPSDSSGLSIFGFKPSVAPPASTNSSNGEPSNSHPGSANPTEAVNTTKNNGMLGALGDNPLFAGVYILIVLALRAAH
jgi:hypothetical protein